MLDFIEEDHGAELAREVARALVTYLQRPGNQAQMSMFTADPQADHVLIRNVMTYITSNISGDLSASVLAMREGVSERQLARLFVQHLGQTPGRYVRRVRVEAARQLLASTDTPITTVAARCGFGSAETLCQAFVDRYGVPPTQYRATASRHNGSHRGRGIAARS